MCSITFITITISHFFENDPLNEPKKMPLRGGGGHMAIPGAHIRAGRGSEPVGRQGPEASPKCWYMYGPCWATAISKLMFPNKFTWYPPLNQKVISSQEFGQKHKKMIKINLPLSHSQTTTFFKTLFKGNNFAVRLESERGEFNFDHYFAFLTDFLKRQNFFAWSHIF